MWYFFARLHAHAIAFQHLLKTSRLLSSWVLQRGRIKLFMISKATNFYDFLPVWGKSSLVGPRWPLFHSIRINILWISISNKTTAAVQAAKDVKKKLKSRCDRLWGVLRCIVCTMLVCMSEFVGAIATLHWSNNWIWNSSRYGDDRTTWKISKDLSRNWIIAFKLN